MNLGADLGMFSNRLNATFDIWKDRRTGVYTIPSTFSSMLGYTTIYMPGKNIGKMETKGWEASLNWKDNIGKDFTYFLSGNISYSNARGSGLLAAFTAPMDADTVRRMLDQNVLKNPVRATHPGHGRVVEELRMAGRQQSHASHREETADRRRPHVPGVITFALGKPVRAKTAGQIAYVNAIESHTITFAIGPAGTGKTYLAVAKAVRAFQDRQVRRIILTRPAVEAGENLGFLPGTLNEKVDPYLRPLYDALSDMLGADQLKRYMDDGTIEVAPLAYMRGRTLNDAFVILDEAQNTTEQQMKMFLTRLGFNTKMVITGDVTQVDLTVPKSGLATIERILDGIDDIAFAHLKPEDVVRHALVGKIVAAYDRHTAIAGDHSRSARAASSQPFDDKNKENA